jgi:hypothetical protein
MLENTLLTVVSGELGTLNKATLGPKLKLLVCSTGDHVAMSTMFPQLNMCTNCATERVQYSKCVQ